MIIEELDKLRSTSSVASQQGVSDVTLSVPPEKLELVWKYTVKVMNVTDEDQFIGILIQSQTKLENKHLLVNLHSFQGSYVVLVNYA